jgi:phenylpropionate dioxygenase-like ring-hydroxylating dioxygenase large terminal subunit
MQRSEACALRCIFHGWKFDVSGELLEIPGEPPPAADFVARASLRRYPVFEGGGLVWVYLGQGPVPPRPPLPFLDLPDDQVWVTRSITPCNWLQGVEATIDSIHVGVLHQSWIKGYRERGQAIGNAIDAHPRYEVEDADWGVKAAAVRMLPDGRQYVRVTQYVMPFVSLVPLNSTNRGGSMFISVPIDNVSHLHFFGLWHEDRSYAADQAHLATTKRDPDNYVVLRHDAEGWGQDREAMRNGHFTGFEGALLEEDMVVQASMGPIVDRTKEHLRASDVGVTHARRRLLEALATLQLGEAPAPAGEIVRPLDVLAEADYAWREHA